MTQRNNKTSFVNDTSNEVSSSVDSETKNKTIFTTIEEYTTGFSSEQRKVIEEYKISKFPNLFTCGNFRTDIESIHPALEMSDPTKLYIAMLEAITENFIKEKGKKNIQ